jgi:hypothetical protein
MLGSLLFVMSILGMIVIVLYVTSTFIPRCFFKTMLKVTCAVISMWLVISFIVAVGMFFYPVYFPYLSPSLV